MFKTKTRIIYLNRFWEQIYSTKSTTIPRLNEYVFIDGLYHEVISVITEPKENRTIIVIEKIDKIMFSEKN